MTDPTEAKLFVVPTPIGNLEDITIRAVRVLSEVHAIACEDTRVTGRLLQLLNIPKRQLISLHAHNEQRKAEEVIEQIMSGRSIALVSDAGTPGISDPGSILISQAIEHDISVEVLPGPVASVVALVGSGINRGDSLFVGFLPTKKGRQTKLRDLSLREETIVLYESPHRVVKTLSQLLEHFAQDRRCVVARELTKLHEEYVRGSIREVHDLLASRTVIKGEIVIVIEGVDSRRMASPEND